MDPLGHFKTITYHKYMVARMCFRVGLYKQGLLHDMSKYMPSEFLTGARYYAGDRSPNSVEREKTGISKAWLHHKGRNKHHFEYWLDYSMDRSENHLIGMKIPKKYMVEMFIDRVCAGKVYNGKKFRNESVYEYYKKGIGCHLLHPESRKYLERMMKMYAEKGEAYTIRYIRKDLKENISQYD
ncbi:MAG: DUF5662 family protein [Lachnospiraceae bacterium]|nr:DUF5662 family protein [Lachnospiraceae bacterium]